MFRKTTGRSGTTLHIRGLALGAVLIVGGCAAAGPTTASGTASTARAVERLLASQARSWNRGDLESFMKPYWHSPELTFSAGGKVTRGWRATLKGYRKRYPSRSAMGHLTFSDLEVTDLGDRVALVLGRWRLERDEPVGGAFTLVLRKVNGRWLIVHDHTSRDDPLHSSEEETVPQ